MSVAVLCTCHGTVETSDDLAAFVRNIRHGRPAPDEVVAEVKRRFEAIGGSPLMRITEAQAAALEARLGVPVRAAARLWHPYPAEVLRPLLAAGVRRIVSLPLAPQSVHVYHAAVEKELAGSGVDLVKAPAWGTEPALVEAFAAAIDEGRRRLPPGLRTATLLTAHSLPKRVIDGGDPYQRDFEAMAGAVQERIERDGIARATTRIAYQSQGMGGGDWLGPDLPATFAALAKEGYQALLVCPIGFLAEHVETLYDIDIEAAQLARDHGFEGFARMPALDARPELVSALEAVARPLLQ
jgi:protoporphyrin/coproporphyrin ferrochelatase